MYMYTYVYTYIFVCFAVSFHVCIYAYMNIYMAVNIYHIGFPPDVDSEVLFGILMLLPFLLPSSGKY